MSCVDARDKTEPGPLMKCVKRKERGVKKCGKVELSPKAAVSNLDARPSSEYCTAHRTALPSCTVRNEQNCAAYVLNLDTLSDHFRVALLYSVSFKSPQREGRQQVNKAAVGR